MCSALGCFFPACSFYVNIWKLFGSFREELSLLAINLGSDAKNDHDKLPPKQQIKMRKDANI